MKDMIKVGVIGCGKISVSHVNVFSDIKDSKIVAACDINGENLKTVCEQTGAKGYSDYKEMLECEQLDLAVIALPHALHNEAVVACAEHGIDIFLEKPMGISTDDCRKMIDVCQENDVMLWVGHPFRYIPAYVFAKELIASGKLGKLVSFAETRNINYFSDDRPRWFLTKKMSGGGIMMNLGAHSLDKLKFFSDSEISEISGNIHMREGYDCEDSAQAFVRMKNGVTGLLNLIGHTNAKKNTTSIYLTEGEIRIEGNKVWYCGKDGVFEEKICEYEIMKYQMRRVVEVLRNGTKKPDVDGEYGLDIVRAIKKLYGEEK